MASYLVLIVRMFGKNSVTRMYRHDYGSKCFFQHQIHTFLHFSSKYSIELINIMSRHIYPLIPYMYIYIYGTYTAIRVKYDDILCNTCNTGHVHWHLRDFVKIAFVIGTPHVSSCQKNKTHFLFNNAWSTQPLYRQYPNFIITVPAKPSTDTLVLQKWI